MRRSLLSPMTPEELFNKQVDELCHSGCLMNNALRIASQEFGNNADQADQLLRAKQKIKWNKKFSRKD